MWRSTALSRDPRSLRFSGPDFKATKMIQLPCLLDKPLRVCSEIFGSVSDLLYRSERFERLWNEWLIEDLTVFYLILGLTSIENISMSMCLAGCLGINVAFRALSVLAERRDHEGKQGPRFACFRLLSHRHIACRTFKMTSLISLLRSYVYFGKGCICFVLFCFKKE